ncbi:hypothetical protein AMTRI_Chr06g169910 [Amborella trichopoda]
MQFHINILMMKALKCWLLRVILLSIHLHVSEPLHTKDEELKLKTSVFLSPKLIMKPGSVQNNYYYNIDFPRGHIAIKGFDTEITYIHHLTVVWYYALPSSDWKSEDTQNSKIVVNNAWVCQDDILNQYFGLGAESRETRTSLYEEGCDLYNVTEDENGRPIEDNYYGGLRCCYDGTQCRLKEGLQGLGAKGVYVKYTVKWMEWDDSIIPFKIYLLDVTDSGERILNSTSLPGTIIEYNVHSNGAPDVHDKKIDIKRARVVIPHGGDLIYGMAHQHGVVICSSSPIYGRGKEAGNETGYVVGMGTCYPKPGSVKVKD